MEKNEGLALHLEDKQQSSTVELEAGNPISTVVALSEAHRRYLLKRHGTLDLDPLPSDDPNEPYNWPRWKSLINLCLVSFHALMIGFVAGGPIPAFGAFAEDFDVSLDAAAYIVSIQILILGVAPLFWRPLSERYGRRPVWLISTFLCTASSIGCAFCKTYAQMMTARAFQAFFNAPAGAIGSAVVVELFFAKERGQKLVSGLHIVSRYMPEAKIKSGLMVTLGNPLGPLVMGFVATRLGWRWIFRIYAIINAAQFFAYLFLAPETRYAQGAGAGGIQTQFFRSYLTFGRIPGSNPLRLRDFWDPITILAKPSVFTTALAHMVIFCFCSVMTCVEIPSLLGSKFDLNYEAIGLNFIPLIIGNVIGEQISGPLSDWWQRQGVKNGVYPPPAKRLWIVYPAFGFCFAGLTVFLVTLSEATAGNWNIRPDIGLAFAGLGNQMSTTILFTYAVEKNIARAGEVGVALVLVRQIWSFIGPFWFPVMFDSIGLVASAGLCSALMAVFAVFVVAGQHFSEEWRRSRQTL